LYPLYLVHIKGTDIVVFSDHANMHCGTIYKLAQDHCPQEVMRVGLAAQSEQEKFISAHCDLRTFAKFVPYDPSTPERDRAAKQAAFTAASLMVFDLEDKGIFCCGVEVDPETLKVQYWLVVQGFTQETRIPLKKYREKPQ